MGLYPTVRPAILGPLLVGQYGLDSFRILCQRNDLFDYTAAKLVIIPLLSCFKRIFLRKTMLFQGELHLFHLFYYPSETKRGLAAHVDCQSPRFYV